MRLAHKSLVDTAWFKSRKREVGASDEKLASAIGRDRTTVTKIINGDVRFDLAFVDGFARVLQTTSHEILARVGVDVTGGGEPASDQPVARSADGGETVEIIRLDLSLPMGPGATVDDYVEEEPVVFDLGHVRTFTRTPPHRLRLARGVGDSMFPTLLNSDLVWIDSTQTNLNQSDKVWAVSINGAAAIKRLRRMKGGRVLVISDNPVVENYEVDEDEVRIGGRIIRFARDL